VVYLVLGATPPNEVREQGEAYRLRLERLAKRNKVQKNVIFYNRFVELDELKEFIGARICTSRRILTKANHLGHAGLHVWGWQGRDLDSLLARDRVAGRRARRAVPFGDAKAIAQEVIGLLRDDTRRHAMRKNA